MQLLNKGDLNTFLKFKLNRKALHFRLNVGYIFYQIELIWVCTPAKEGKEESEARKWEKIKARKI